MSKHTPSGDILGETDRSIIRHRWKVIFMSDELQWTYNSNFFMLDAVGVLRTLVPEPGAGRRSGGNTIAAKIGLISVKLNSVTGEKSFHHCCNLSRLL